MLAHADAHDGVVGAWKDPRTGDVQFDSCRIFTDRGNAKRFAMEQGQRSIFDLARNAEIWLSKEAKVQ